jgi:hypothetical protein
MHEHDYWLKWIQGIDLRSIEDDRAESQHFTGCRNPLSAEDNECSWSSRDWSLSGSWVSIVVVVGRHDIQLSVDTLSNSIDPPPFAVWRASDWRVLRMKWQF